MRVPSESMLTWLGIGLIAVGLSACATAVNPLTSTTEFDTLMPGWESKFSIAWKSEPAPDGSIRVYGRIASHYGQYASPFRVLGMAIDASGKVVAQRVEWVPGGVPGFTDVYFEIDHLVVAASYRVTVWDYTVIEDRGGTLQ
jgi:hypothetical protein